MQNKGFVKFVAVVLTLICCFYFSFSFVTRHYDKKAAQITALKGEAAGKAYLDSMENQKVFLGWKTLKECRELQIGLGLDLEGGMNVILEVSIPDVVNSLAGENAQDATFKKAVAQAQAGVKAGDGNFVDLFVKAYEGLKGQNKLAGVFAANAGMKEKINFNSSDDDVRKALTEQVESAIENANEVVRTRIDRFGVAQPNIQILKGRGQQGQIMVEMPGIKEPDRVRKLLQGSASLEFWETYTGAEALAVLQQLDARNSGKAVDTTATDTAKTQVKGSKSEVLLGQYLMPSPSAEASASVGYARAADTATVNRILASQTAQDLLPRDMKFAWDVKTAQGLQGNFFELYALKAIEGGPAMAGEVIASAAADFDQHRRPVVSMQMNTAGAREWGALTTKTVGKAVAIVLDGYVYSAPRVNEPMTTGSSQISGSFTTDDTRDLANVLNSGKMPAPTKIVSEETVGPSLGSASIQAGLTACAVAFVVLMIYMCLMYGFIPGMVANLALIFNFFLTFGVLISFQAALTMSGIAGMVLTLGMAVDANVLIYERTKEELRAGKNVRQALADGYSNAFSAIFDSNLTSIITAVILYYFGTGPIRGFALTLGIGIVASFFTAVWMTRLVYEHFHGRDKWLGLTFTTPLFANFLTNTKVRFMENRGKAYIVVAALAILFVGSLAVRGLSKGIDFTGGRNYVIEFSDKHRNVTPEEIASTVRTAVQSEDPNATVSAIAIVTTSNKAVRLTTNYKIDSDANETDTEVEGIIYKSLKAKGYIDAPTQEVFSDRNNKTGGSIISAQKVGPSVAADITRSAIISVVLALAAIFVYILIRFRNVAFSLGSVGALALDTTFIIGMYSLCWGVLPFSLEIDQTFIGAILTAIGYSINDKVVVFDRVREYLHLYPTRNKLQLFNDSLNSTLTRTVTTSSTTLVVLLCIFFLGGDSIRSFSFAMILGVIFGTLSSIFLALPIAYQVMVRKEKK